MKHAQATAMHCNVDLEIWDLSNVNSGAVYLDVVDDYSAHAVIMTLSRFGNIRGWPGVISSDPGSQLQ